MDSFFAVTAPGLEPFTGQELNALGLLPGAVTDPDSSLEGSTSIISPQSDGGLTFKGDLSALYRANLHLRTASRVLARLGNFFSATTFPELQKRASHLPWERFLKPGQPVSLRVTCHRSKLYHSDAVARAVAAALADRMGQPSPVRRADEETGDPPQLVVVRLAEDKCTVSVDSSGVLLHKRGYRQAVAKAPLRETLAAALLLASGWDTASPLLDPFCGSGTIPIEAALMARRIPPGINRRFAFMQWPNYDEKLWLSIKDIHPTSFAGTFSIHGSDRDAGAIEMSRANAERAGVAESIEFKCQAVSAINPPSGKGWVVTNPPYGLRVSGGKDLRNLYAQFGNVLRQHCPGWNLSVLCSDAALLGQMRLKLDTSLELFNGGIRVRLGRGIVR